MVDNIILETFIRNMIEIIPDLKIVYEMHLSDYDEILPHVFLGDVTRYIVNSLNSQDKEKLQSVVQILDYFEFAITNGTKEVQELISVSFLENITEYKREMNQMNLIMGTNLKKELDAYDI